MMTANRTANLTPPDLDNSALFYVHERVPILDAHIPHVDAEYPPITPERLELLARNSNALADRGDFPAIIPGHTNPDKPETEQPPIWGYARNFVVGEFRGVPTLLADFYVKQEHVDDARTMPHRSVEFWHGALPEDWLTDYISIQRTTPERFLGHLTLSRQARWGRTKARLSRTFSPAFSAGQIRRDGMGSSSSWSSRLKASEAVLQALAQEGIEPDDSEGERSYMMGLGSPESIHRYGTRLKVHLSRRLASGRVQTAAERDAAIHLATERGISFGEAINELRTPRHAKLSRARRRPCTRAQMEIAINFATENGISFEDALTQLCE